ncbi:hypothetical protein N2152v2_000498 [Parachlorella kessleri]
MGEVWEKKPQVFKATPERKAVFQNLVTFKALQKLATAREEEGEPLLFGTDINAVRYANGVRETPNGDEVADAGSLKDLFVREGCTMQVHQPQRFVDPLWRLLAALERQLGCLVGCNAYLTPKQTQGLAPHHDDVEIFVVQTEGAKRWSVYPPASGSAETCELANCCSGDLDEQELDQPLMEFILEVGDVLYMPRGTIHQAKALNGHSSHLTISTYQRWAWADLMQYTISVALANSQLQPELPRQLREGLPLRWLDAATLSAADVGLALPTAGQPAAAAARKKNGINGNGQQKVTELARGELLGQLATAFRSMADWLDGGAGGAAPLPQASEVATGVTGAGERALLAAADAMAGDYMEHRLPPYPDQVPDLGPEPTLESRVAWRGPGLFRLVPLPEQDNPPDDSDSEGDEEEESEEEDEAGEGPQWVRLVSCLMNSREDHMMSSGHEDASDEDNGCCTDPGCQEEHCHDHRHACESDHERGHGGSQDEQGEAQGSDEEDAAMEAEQQQAVTGKDEAEGPTVGKGGSKRPGSAGQKRKQRGVQEEAQHDDPGAGANGAEELGSLSGSEVEDVDLETLVESDEEAEEEVEELQETVFPVKFVPALLQLMGSSAASGGVRVRDLQLPGGEPELCRGVCAELWSIGALATLPASPVKPTEKKGSRKGREAKV